MTQKSDPLTKLAELTQAQASRREAAREENRRRFPELAAVMESLGEHARMRCVYDLNGNVLVGKPPEPEESFSAEFLCAMAFFGDSQRKRLRGA